MSSPRDSATKSARSRRSGQKLTDHDHSEILDQHQLQQQPSGKGGKVDQQQQKQQESPAPAPAPTVDSLLIAYSPPNETIHELASLNLGSYQSHLYHHQHQVPPVSYAKVRPEPINERSIVDSVVGFFHDVVGGEGAHSRSQHPSLLGHHHQSNKRVGGSGNSSALLGQPAIAEIKEQIEWIHFENFVNLDAYLNQSACSSSTSSSSASSSTSSSTTSSCSNAQQQQPPTTTTTATSIPSNNNSSLLLVIGYKTGFAIWTIDLNGVATEALSIKEPNITHVKLLKIESPHRLLVAVCKLVINDTTPPMNAPPAANSDLDAGAADIMSGSSNLSSHSSSSLSSQQQQSSQTTTQQQISILNLLTGECLHEITFNGEVLEMKSNGHLLCVNSWNRIDAFDLETFEHRFSINSCYSQISKSSGQQTNPFAIGDRWLAFADNKFHSILSSQGGVSTDVEQSYTATVLNTAKNISKGLAKISESVVNSVVSKTSKTATAGDGAGHSPRLGGGAGGAGKMRNDSKDDYQPGICTIVDTKRYVNTSKTPCSLYDENQNWIVAHFLAHQEAIYALEFNPNGRLLCSADCLGQYFNVFQINSNPYKSTRTFVKHLYSLYRGDTSSKVKNMSFSADSRWLAISTKRGTTHIFPINCYGGTVNARTHSKPYVVNRTSKHQRTAGFIDPEDLPYMGGVGMPANSGGGSGLLMTGQMGGGGSDGQQSSLHDSMGQLIINNNPKLKSLLEPLVISAYGQLKQPNANSSFQSSIISTNASSTSSVSTNSGGLLTSVAASQANQNADHNSSAGNSSNGLQSSSNAASGSTLAASALSSAALVTENVTSFGIKNFSLLATNTSNMIQYDNVCTVACFGDSRGYLTPEEPRDFALNRLRPAPSLFVISDVNGNLVEYQLDVVVDTSRAPNNKPTNDSPVLLKLTPKAQWPLQRFISSDELRYPIHPDNPLLCNSIVTQTVMRKHSNANHGVLMDGGAAGSPASGYSRPNYSPNALFSNSPTSSLFPSFAAVNQPPLPPKHGSDDWWIKLIEINTHMGPHRRLFMGPQFVFKTFNSNLSTTLLNAGSSSVMSDAPETPVIDLAGDIELNSLDLSLGNNSSPADALRKYASHRTTAALGHATTSPMQINTFNRGASKQQQLGRFDSTPTYIEVGAGSYQEGMPIMCGAGASSTGSRGSQKSLNSLANGGNSGGMCGVNNGGNSQNSGLCDLLGDNLIESLADAMSDATTWHGAGTNTPNSVSSSGAGSMHHSPLLAAPASAGSSSAAFNNGSNAATKHRGANSQQQQQQQFKNHYVQPLQPLQAANSANNPLHHQVKSHSSSSSSNNNTPTQAIAINSQNTAANSSGSGKIKKSTAGASASKEENLLLMHAANSASPSLTVGSYLLINDGGSAMNGVASALNTAAAAATAAASSSSASNSYASSPSKSSSSSSSASSSANNSNEEDNVVSSSSTSTKHHHNTAKHHNHHHHGGDGVFSAQPTTQAPQQAPQRFRPGRHLASIENLDLDDEPNLMH